ncbi:unnamed protein product [Colias eurytheme]|nr:unnamed protein product [Colias eurytheme]
MKCLLLNLFYIGALVSCKENSLNNFVSTVGEIIHNISSQRNFGVDDYEFLHRDENINSQERKSFNSNEDNNIIYTLDDTQDIGKDVISTINEDDMCKSGRCGCGRPGRCGTSNSNKINELLDDVFAQLEQDRKDNEKLLQFKESKEISHVLNNQRNNIFSSDPFRQAFSLKTDLTRTKEKNKKKTKVNDEDPSNVLKVLLSDIYDLTDDKSNEKQQLKRSRIPFAPKEIARFYNEFKDQATIRIFNYVKDLSPKKSLPYLTLKPRREFERLKKRYRQKRMKDNELAKEIVDMLLGNKGNMRIMPHRKCNMYEIIVPKWVYVAFYKMRKNERQKKKLIN